MNFDNLSVRQKFAVPLAFVSFLVLLVSIISISNSRFLSTNTETQSAVFTKVLKVIQGSTSQSKKINKVSRSIDKNVGHFAI
ncbi:hypothetical protein [Alteromonas halophila]|uniref:Uncharacterized protein n=1 Tax=Alteromonas halophila TaxID=516698 RepID=A0A918JDC3_9ALTE|nr:hypothetical protein [Alteromonas halophila]GGW75641.1 hypothetical protein GCM10007391_04960 [Alteromonas halophila]